MKPIPRFDRTGGSPSAFELLELHLAHRPAHPELVGAQRIAQLRETLETIYDRLDSAD